MWQEKPQYSFDDLMELVALLRDPEKGCAWDKVQTHESIRKNLLEEAYEAADAIDLKDTELLCEELGDVLLQVAMHTQMEQEQGRFSAQDVCTGVCQKLIRRHPHIFGQVQTPQDDARQVLERWEQIKRTEKKRESLADDLADVPAALPALMRAQKMQKRAAVHGVGLTDEKSAGQAMYAAMQRLQAAAPEELEIALGELLFCAAGYGRLRGADAEQALECVNTAFQAAARRQNV